MGGSQLGKITTNVIVQDVSQEVGFSHDWWRQRGMYSSARDVKRDETFLIRENNTTGFQIAEDLGSFNPTTPDFDIGVSPDRFLFECSDSPNEDLFHDPSDIISWSQPSLQSHRSVTSHGDSICDGEVIEMDGGEVICWIEVSPDCQIRSSFPVEFFRDLDKTAGAEFRWNAQENEILPPIGASDETIREIERLSREWDDDLCNLTSEG